MLDQACRVKDGELEVGKGRRMSWLKLSGPKARRYERPQANTARRGITMNEVIFNQFPRFIYITRVAFSGGLFTLNSSF